MKLNIKTKLIGGFMVAVVLLLAVFGVAFNGLNSMQNSVDTMMDVNVQTDDLAMETDISMLMARRAEKDYLLKYKELGFAEAKAKYVTQVQDQVASIQENVAAMKQMEEDEEHLAKLSDIAKYATEYETAFLSTVTLLEQRGFKDTGLEGMFRSEASAIQESVTAAGEDQLMIDLLMMRRHEKDYLLRGEDKYVTSLEEAVATFKADTAAAGLSSSQQGELNALADEYLDGFHQLVAVDGQVAASIEVFREATHMVEPIIDEVGVLASADAIEARVSVNETASTSTMITIIIAVIAALVSISLGWFLAQSISSGVNKVSKGLNKIAIGDVTEKVIVKSQDEIGAMAKAYANMQAYLTEMVGAAESIADGDLTASVTPKSENDALGNAFVNMIANLRDLIGKVKGNARDLAENSEQLSRASEQAGQATNQISATSQQVARGAGEQSTALQETTQGVQQLSQAIEQISKGAQEQARGMEKNNEIVIQVSAAVEQIARNAGEAAEGSKQAAENAGKGAQMARNTVEGMEKVKISNANVSARVTELGDRSNEIGKIVATIDDIAAQTNLLALNAAIEAARAGEQGRGFAVVADEVRQLAERSSQATKEIADLIKGIQQSVSEAVKAMESGTVEVENGYQLATEAGNSLEEILGSSTAVGSQVEQISAAVQELTALTENMVRVSDEIAKVVETNTAATEQMSASSDQVSKSVESVAGVAEENSAATEQVSASAQQMSAQVEEVVASSQSLAAMSEELQKAVSLFRIEDDGNGSGRVQQVAAVSRN